MPECPSRSHTCSARRSHTSRFRFVRGLLAFVGFLVLKKKLGEFLLSARMDTSILGHSEDARRRNPFESARIVHRIIADQWRIGVGLPMIQLQMWATRGHARRSSYSLRSLRCAVFASILTQNRKGKIMKVTKTRSDCSRMNWNKTSHLDTSTKKNIIYRTRKTKPPFKKSK